MKLGEAIYKAQMEEAKTNDDGASGNAGGGASASKTESDDDNVVDADYEDVNDDKK